MMTTPGTLTRRGLSLVEVLVVVGMIGLLAVLLISGVQAAREAARRVRCANNLRQLGLGLASYQAAAGVLPLGNSHNLYSVHVSILPFIEQGPLFHSIKFAFDAFLPSVENLTVAQATLNVMVCPSDIGAPEESPMGGTNYAGNRGVGVQRFGYNGAFATSFQPAIGPSHFVDGASTTAAMAEQVLGEAAGDGDRRRVVLRPRSRWLSLGNLRRS